jgi:hypothetical protein
MALQGSGAISLNDIHLEAGGTTGTGASINDADIRALIGKGAGVSMAFNEWYGASNTIDYPAFVASNIELGSAAGDSLTGSKAQTGPSVLLNGNYTGYNFRVFANTYGVFLYIREYNAASTSYYYTPANVQTVLSTTDILASRDNGTIQTAKVTNAKIELVYTTTDTGGSGGQRSTILVNNNTWTAIANGGSVNTTIRVGTGADCYASVSRTVLGSVNIYLRGPGYNDGLVVSHDFRIYSAATSNRCY